MVTSATQPARPIVEAYLGRLDLPGTTVRTLAAGHWGLTLEAAGWPLHIGVAVRQGVLEALVDRVLGAVVTAATAIRERARDCGG